METSGQSMGSDENPMPENGNQMGTNEESVSEDEN